MQIKMQLKNSIIVDTSTDWVRELISDQLNEDGIDLETASKEEIHEAARAILEDDMGQLIDFDSLTADDWEIEVEGVPEPPAIAATKSEGQG